MKAKVTKFPESIDSKSYFSNISLMNQNILNEHHTLMALKKYQEACQKLEESNVDFYSAELFNYLEECLYKIGNEIIKKGITPARPYYSSSEPTNLQENMIWITRGDV